MSESEEQIKSGVIANALKAARATSKAAQAVEQQVEAFASFSNYTPTAEELTDVPEVGVKEMIAVLGVAKLGSFTKASAELGVSQPGLSRQVQRVEKVYGFQFFDRSVKDAPVTPRGQLVIEAFTDALSTLARSVKAAKHLS
ncbi:LysR family transcriptional regulator [Dehalococcoides mccartyi]|nr:LysR family transcriptional regulator [Dehalococcoides mccartyi]